MSARTEEVKRAIEMLRIAARFIIDNAAGEMVFYDDAECDGLCLADDCRIAADVLALRIARGELSS